MNSVMVWRWTLLPASETFIRNQISSYTTWKATAVGAVAEKSPNADASDKIVFSKSSFDQLQKRVFRVTDLSFSLPKVVDAIAPTIIHAHFAIDGMRMRAIAKRRRIPLVVTLHGSDITSSPSKPGLRGRRYRIRLQKLFRDADLFVAVSKHIARSAQALGLDKSKIVVLPLGVPWKQAPTASVERKNVVFVGRVVEKKGLEYLLESLAKLESHVIGHHRLIVIGDGPLRSELEARSRELNLPVDFLGIRTPEEVQHHMERAVCLAVPSVTAHNGDTEGLPTVVFEAFRAATPVVGFNHAGIPEAVQNGYSGLLVEERDVAGLAMNLGQLLTDPTLTLKLGLNARASFEQDYESSRQTKKLEALYERLVG